MYQQQQYQQNNNVCDLDSISVHDISDFDPAHYGTFTYGDYLQELQELEQGRTPMKIDRQPQLPRDLTNLHWLHHNDQQPNQGRQQPISLMVDPNTNLPVQFTTATGGRLHISGQQNITFMAMPTQHHLVQQTAQQSQQHFQQQQQQRHDIQHLQQKYASHDGKNKDATAVVVGTNGAKIFPKPVFSYSCLIAMALKNSEHGSLPVSEIYKYMQSRFPYFKTAPDGWKNSVRHNLSLNKAFCKLERPDGTSQRKGCLWSLKPEKKDQLRREIRKWKKKHPEAIKASMANPDDLSISSDSCDDDSLEEPHSISSSSKVPSPSDIHQRVPEMCMERPPSTPLLHDQQVKSEHLVGDEVEDAAKELFGADLLFSQDDIHNTEDFWNDLITSSEQHIKYNEVEKFDSHMQKFDTYDDIIEVESSVKLETATPSSNFFSSALHQPTLTGF